VPPPPQQPPPHLLLLLVLVRALRAWRVNAKALLLWQ
jgi:hypothetical protein